MTAKEFEKEMAAVQERARKRIVYLVTRARTENADGVSGSEPVNFADNPNWQRAVDGLAEQAGWIYDRMNGRSVSDKKNGNYILDCLSRIC